MMSRQFLMAFTSLLSVYLVGEARIIHVPDDVQTVQEAINIAGEGDTVLVEPGVYHGSIVLNKRKITLTSRFLETKDPHEIYRTVLDGSSKGRKGDFVIKVTERATGVRIIGFTIRNGDDGITCSGEAQILNNYFTGNEDGIDYEDGRGICRSNTFERNGDDAVDLDGASEVLIEDNVIRDNDDDGIEIRLHEYSGPTLKIVICHNIITGNGEDGIQIIDYPDLSDRLIRIERNVIANNAMAALGCMGDGKTKENYEAADIPEPIYFINNTVVGNTYGITGGDNLIALNNIFFNMKRSALKGVDGRSVVAYSLFWGNGLDFEMSNLEKGIVRADPMLGEGFKLKEESPAIDAGTARFKRESRVILDLKPNEYFGSAPDLGAFEFALTTQRR